MVNSNASTLGIIFPNSYDSLVPDLVDERLMAALPFAGRYRIIDFLLSSMSNCGMNNISILPSEKYHSLMEYVASGRDWDLVRKNGGVNIFPPFAEKNFKMYNGRVDALENILPFLKECKEKYVLMCDSNIVTNFDIKALIDAHVESGADVTIAYTEQTIPDELLKNDSLKDMYYTLKVVDGKVDRIYMNMAGGQKQNLSMNIYVIDRELLCDMIHSASVRGYVYFERDILAPRLEKYNVRAYKYEGYCSRITGMKSYFDENMRLLKNENLDALFDGNPIRTRVRDDNPTRYIGEAKVKNTLVADGCVIEGEVENCVLFRGVKVGKGAKVKNCVIMQDTVIEENAELEYIVTDKNVTVGKGKSMKGTDTFPVYVKKFHVI